MFKGLAAVGSLVGLLFTGSTCIAADLGERITIIHVKHNAKTYDIERWDAVDRKVVSDIPLQDRQKISLRPGERVKIQVDDPNKFLYRYALTDGKTTETANGAAAQSFTNSLLSVVKILDPAKTSSKVDQSPKFSKVRGQIMLASFQQDSQALPAAPSSPPGSSSDILEQAAKQLETVVLPSHEALKIAPTPNEARDYAQQRLKIVTQTIEAVGRKPIPNIGGGAVRKALKDAGIPDPGQFLQDFKKKISELYLYLSQVNSMIKAVDTGNALPAQATVASWSVDKLSENIKSAYDKIHNVNQELSIRLGVQQEIRGSEELRDAIALEAEKNKDKDIDVIIMDVLKKELELAENEQVAFGTKIDTTKNKLKSNPSGVSPQEIKELEENTKLRDAVTRRLLTLTRFNERILELRDLAGHISRDPVSLNLDLLKPYERDVKDSLRELENFAASMAEVVKAEPLGTAEYSGLVSPKILTIEAAKDSPKEVKPTRSMTEYTFAFQPYSGVQLEPGAGVVFSFVKQHAFSTTRNAQGKLVITDTESGDYTGTSGALMLVIIPSKWAASDFYGLFEIGAKADSNVGLYAGAGIKLTNFFSAGAGVAFEQVNELKGSLKPGDEVASDDQVKTQKRFTAGLYVHLTVSMKLGGNN
jgi:hypothetical protein